MKDIQSRLMSSNVHCHSTLSLYRESDKFQWYPKVLVCQLGSFYTIGISKTPHHALLHVYCGLMCHIISLQGALAR